jgi:hypothetical protein
MGTQCKAKRTVCKRSRARGRHTAKTSRGNAKQQAHNVHQHCTANNRARRQLLFNEKERKRPTGLEDDRLWCTSKDRHQPGGGGKAGRGNGAEGLACVVM